MIVTHRTLIVLAALTWFSGGAMLGSKGIEHAMTLHDVNTNQAWLAIAAGIIAGVLKVRFLFNRFCRRNLERIAALETPRIWQFFRLGFYPALALMILFGGWLSHAAGQSHNMLVTATALDLSLAIALLGSGLNFFRRSVNA